MTQPHLTLDLPLSQKIALVTGASRGIGHACALGLAKAGAHIIACARTKKALEALDDEIFAATGQHATLIPFDLTDFDGIDTMAQAVMNRFGRIDICIHAAGILGTLMPVSHHEPKEFDRILKVNLISGFRLIRALEPLLKASEAGRFLGFSTSPEVLAGRAFWGPYGALKAAFNTLIKAWADEIEITPVRAIMIEPGPMRTKMRAAAYPGEDELSLPHPDEIVPFVLSLLDTSKPVAESPASFKAFQRNKS